MHFCDAAQVRFDSWLTDHINRVRSSYFDNKPAFRAHLGKYQGLVAKLALLFHMLDHMESGYIPPVSLEALELAIRWAEFLEAHARKISAPELLGVPIPVRELALHILDGDISDGASLRAIYRHGWTGLKKAEPVIGAAKVLVKKGWIRIDRVTSSGKGRPSEVVSVNPGLFSLERQFKV